MTSHIDTLAGWWREAEKPVYVDPGDLMIQRHEPNDYSVTSSTVRFKPPADSIRILARAPKPKPAWHDAVAVIAGLGGERQVFTPTVSGMWESEDSMLTPDEMANPVPLIEAKVTDEMVKRAIDKAEGLGYIERVFGEIDGIDHNAMAEIVTAALGLEHA